MPEEVSSNKAQSAQTTDPNKLAREVAERVWKLWQEEIRRDRERRPTQRR